MLNYISEQYVALLKSEIGRKYVTKFNNFFMSTIKLVLNVGGGAFGNIWRHC